MLTCEFSKKLDKLCSQIFISVILTCQERFDNFLKLCVFTKLLFSLQQISNTTQNFGDSTKNSSDQWNRLYEKKTLASSRREVFHHDPQVYITALFQFGLLVSEEFSLEHLY